MVIRSIRKLYDPRLRARVVSVQEVISTEEGFAVFVYPFNTRDEAAKYMNSVLARAHITPEQQEKLLVEELKKKV